MSTGETGFIQRLAIYMDLIETKQHKKRLKNPAIQRTKEEIQIRIRIYGGRVFQRREER